MKIQYKKVHKNMDKKMFEIEPEIYEGILYNDEIIYKGQIDEGVVLHSFLKGDILIVDNEYHIETKTMNSSELTDFLYKYNKDYLNWNKKKLFKGKKIIYEDGELKIVDE